MKKMAVLAGNNKDFGNRFEREGSAPKKKSFYNIN